MKNRKDLFLKVKKKLSNPSFFQKNFRKKTAGFSLLEVLIALVLVSGVAMVTTNMWSKNFLFIRSSRIYDTASSLLDQKISELKIEYKDVANLPESQEGVFGTEFSNYRWEMESQPFDMPDISSLIIEQADAEGIDENALLIVNNIKELIKSSVKEVKVTVFVKDKNRERAYSIVTYFTSENPSLQALPGGG